MKSVPYLGEKNKVNGKYLLAGTGLFISGLVAGGILFSSHSTEEVAPPFENQKEMIYSKASEDVDLANELINKGMGYTNYSEISLENSLLMFDYVSSTAENKPELMDHFGMRAHQYMEQQFLDNYTRQAREQVGSAKDIILSFLEDARNYIMED